MAKGGKKGGRRRCQGDDDDDDDAVESLLTLFNHNGCHVAVDDNDDVDDDGRQKKKKSLEERRAKQRCHLCGALGHIPRLCPGKDADDIIHAKDNHKSGRKKGPTKKKGPATTVHSQFIDGYDPVLFPKGFSRNHYYTNRDRIQQEDGSEQEQPFLFYDAGCDSVATLEYIRAGGRCHHSSQHKFEMSHTAAVAVYQATLDKAKSSFHYGGRISRSYVKAKHLLWDPKMDGGFNDNNDNDNNVWYILGLDPDFLSNSAIGNGDVDSGKETSISSLVVAHENHPSSVVGFFCHLDYSCIQVQSTTATTTTKIDKECKDREDQIRRLFWTCQAATKVGVSIQIRVLPAAPLSRRQAHTMDPTAPNIMDPTNNNYRHVMADLEALLRQIFLHMPSLKVHLSCWSGDAADMNRLLATWPQNVWIGMDASVTFAKVLRAHECAFDIPLSRLVLETGGPATIPSSISKAQKGRRAAFCCHSGLIPFVAEAIAKLKASRSSATLVGTAGDTSTGVVTAVTVARSASENTRLLYPQIA